MSFNLAKQSYNVLERIYKTLTLLSRNGGFVILPAGTYSDVKYRMVRTLEATTFTSFQVEGVEQLSARGMSAVSIPLGVDLSGGGEITRLVISVGSVIAYK